jgi:hypothetical protein
MIVAPWPLPSKLLAEILETTKLRRSAMQRRHDAIDVIGAGPSIRRSIVAASHLAAVCFHRSLAVETDVSQRRHLSASTTDLLPVKSTYAKFSVLVTRSPGGTGSGL